MKFTEYLRDKGACSDIDEYEKYASAREAWEGSTSVDDLMWAVTTIDSVRGARLAIELAKSVLKYVPEGEDRPAKAIEAAEGYLSGEVSRKDLIAAANAAAGPGPAASAASAAAAAAAAAAYAGAATAATAASHASHAAHAAHAAAHAAASRAEVGVAQWVRDRVNFSDLVDGLDIE